MFLKPKRIICLFAAITVLVGMISICNISEARAGAENPCLKCNTWVNNLCGGIGNTCASMIINCQANSCISCVNQATSFKSIIASKDPADGARKQTTQADCGKKTTGGTCKRMRYDSDGDGIPDKDGLCYCEGGTATTQDGGCGKKDTYETCTPS